MSTKNRIAVIGAGLAGLAAATALENHGHNVVVYEARDRVGGRVWSERIRTTHGFQNVERGAEFVLAGYSIFRSYCEIHGLSLVDTGMSYYVREAADYPNVTTNDLAVLGQEAAAAAHARHGPRSIADVLNEIKANGAVRSALEARVEISTAVRTDEVTAEETLDHVASFDPGPSWRVAGGNQLLPDSMATALTKSIQLNHVVESVQQSSDSVQVTVNGRTHSFDRVVVALPFGVLCDRESIVFDLPEWKTDALSRVVQGHAAKLQIPLDTVPDTSAIMSVADRFWTWTANSSATEVAPVLNCFGGELSHLRALGIAEGHEAWKNKVRELRSDLDISGGEALLTAWPFDPLARGAYTAHAPGFTANDATALAAPVDRIHFAGEYIDLEYAGLMEGALRSGHRAAQAIEDAFTMTVSS